MPPHRGFALPGNTYTLAKGGDNTGFAPGIVVKNVVFTLTVADDGTHSLKAKSATNQQWTIKGSGRIYMENPLVYEKQRFVIEIEEPHKCKIAFHRK